MQVSEKNTDAAENLLASQQGTGKKTKIDDAGSLMVQQSENEMNAASILLAESQKK